MLARLTCGPASRPPEPASLGRRRPGTAAAPTVLALGGHFHYVHQLEDSEARVAILEFATEVDGLQVEGIDKLTVDQEGRIAEMKVMLRPASALQVVGAHMAQEFARLGLAASA